MTSVSLGVVTMERNNVYVVLEQWQGRVIDCHVFDSATAAKECRRALKEDAEDDDCIPLMFSETVQSESPYDPHSGGDE